MVFRLIVTFALFIFFTEGISHGEGQFLEERVELYEPLPEDIIKHLPFDINQQIAYFIKLFTTEKREVTERWFKRCGALLPYFKVVFAEEGLPEDLVYLAMIESGCNPFAVSRAGAVGIWQFMDVTARSYGLKIDFWIDERRDFIASTRAAAKYLSRLYQIFHDWRIAVASYNAGEGRVLRGLKAKNFTDYWKAMMGGGFPLETFAYVPQWLAISALAKNPEKYKLPSLREEPLDLVEVEVPGGFELKSLALAAELDPEFLYFLNAKFRRGFTPPGNRSHLVIPYEKKSVLLNNLYSLSWKEIELKFKGEEITLYALNDEEVKRLFSETPAKDLKNIHPKVLPRRKKGSKIKGY